MKSTAVLPRINHWYVRWDSGELFKVTDVNETLGTVQVQGFGGRLETLQEREWSALSVSPTDPPSNWRSRPAAGRRGRTGSVWTEPTLG